MNRKLTSLLLFLMMTLLLVGLFSVAEGDRIRVDAAHFPDEAFRKYILYNCTNYSSWEDDSREYYLTDNLGWATDYGKKLIIPYSAIERYNCGPIKDLTGIEYFPNLVTLKCDGNSISQLNLSRNPALKTINCANNSLTELNLTGLTQLEELICNDNQLTNIQFADAVLLTNIVCDRNQLSSLDIGSTLLSLKKLSCSSNQLTLLNLSRCNDLTELDCSSNQLTDAQGLVLDNKAKLEKLYISDNQIPSLDLRNCVSLKKLYCEYNSLSYLDVRSQEELSNSVNFNMRGIGWEDGVDYWSNIDDLNSGRDDAKLRVDSYVTVEATTTRSERDDTMVYTRIKDSDANGTYLITGRVYNYTINGKTIYYPKTQTVELVSPLDSSVSNFTVPIHVKGPSNQNMPTSLGSRHFGEDVARDYETTGIQSGACKGMSNLADLDIEHTGEYDDCIPFTIGAGAFQDCKNLVSVQFMYGLDHGKSIEIGNSAFQGCVSLNPNWLSEYITTIGKSAFEGCKGMTSFEIGSKITSIPDSAFANCTSLMEVTGGKAVKKLGNNAFSGCKKLSSVPSFSAVTSIGDGAFKNCALKKATIPAKVTTIGKQAFAGCSKMKTLVIGKSVKSIGEKAFNGCKKLKSITINTTKLTKKGIGKSCFNGISKKATFKCPKKKLKNYEKWILGNGKAPETATFTK